MAEDTKSTKYTRYTLINNLIWYSVGIFDYLNTSAIYSGYVTQALMQVFHQTLQFIFFPIYAINTTIYAILGLIHLLFDRDNDTKKIKKENIVRFVINTISALIVCTAVIGTLAFAATLGIATTILFALNLAVTGIYNFAAGGYHLYQFIKKGLLLKNDNFSKKERTGISVERKAHWGSILGHFGVGITIAAVSLAGGLAILGGFLPLAAFGIAGGLIGVGLCIFGIVDGVKKLKAHKSEENKSAKNKSTMSVIKTLGNNLTAKLKNAFRHKENKNPKPTDKKTKKIEEQPLLANQSKTHPVLALIRRRKP